MRFFGPQLLLALPRLSLLGDPRGMRDREAALAHVGFVRRRAPAKSVIISPCPTKPSEPLYSPLPAAAHDSSLSPRRVRRRCCPSSINRSFSMRSTKRSPPERTP